MQVEDPAESSEEEANEEVNLRQGEAPEALLPRFAEQDVQLRRAPGRPQIARTGARGRPRKIFNVVENRNNLEEADSAQEIAGVAEVSLREAMSGSNAKEWKSAIEDEFRSLIGNDTWELVNRPQSRNVISCRIVLRNKYGLDGEIERRKARLVARGFTQRPGIDFHETFAPVARLSSFRTLTALAVENDLTIHQLDITTAYLNGRIEEEIYMDLPELLEDSLTEIAEKTKLKETKNIAELHVKAIRMLNKIKTGGKVCLLKRGLYGLRQAGRKWHEKFDAELRQLGMKPLNADPCVYVANRGSDVVILAAYVDDILLASRNLHWMAEIKRKLGTQFDVKDLGEVRHCLGIEFVKGIREIRISQSKYAEEVLKRFGMENAKPVATPVDTSTKLMKPESHSEEDMKQYPFREVIGSLMYLAVGTRPDIAFAVNSLSQYNTCYTKEHWVAAKRVLRYIKGTLRYGLTFKKTEIGLQGFADADWGACTNDRRSYTGYAFTLGGATISWEAKKQRTVALSSTEAEYMALTEAVKEAIHLRRFLKEIGVQMKDPTPIWNDNQGAQKLAQNAVFHNRTKHIDIRHHFVREVLKDGSIKVDYMPTTKMMADVLTKGLGGPRHQEHITGMGVGPV